MKKLTFKKESFKGMERYLKGWSLQTLLGIALLLTPTLSIFPHGTVTSPPSRVWICYQEDPQSPDSPACEASIIGWGTQAFYDWNEVARMDAGGMHQVIIPDGNLASAGRPDKYGGLDQVRSDWVTTQVTPGPFTVTWTNSAPHETLYYRVYITKANWTPDQPLTWDSLELLVETDPRPSAATDIIDVVLPQRTGKHVIYSVWQRSLTPEAFYSTSDVDFGGSTPTTNEPPVASFTSDSGRCGGPEVTFDASDSYDPNGDILTYTWDFGDGTTAEGITVSHTFENLDNATVELTVSDSEFSSGAVETVDLVADPDCEAIVCPFDTPSDSPLPSIVNTYKNIYVVGENGPNFSNVTKFDINWNLQNSNGLYVFALMTDNGIPDYYNDFKTKMVHSFNTANPAVTLTNTGFTNLDGAYYVTLDGDNFVMVSQTGDFTIYFGNSEIAPECGDIVEPNTAPIADLRINPNGGIAPLEVLFDASTSSDADGDILSFFIDYGDGTTGSGAVSTHTYTQEGDYIATVTVDDGNGGTDTASVSVSVVPDIIVGPRAVLNASPVSGTTPLEVVFDASDSSHPDNDVLSYSIDYGDGTSGTGVITTHIYTIVGIYTATVTVNDSNGGTDTASIIITVNDNEPINTPPIVDLIATPTTGTAPLEVAFDASGSTDADGDSLSFTIDYGDGATSTGATSTHTYTTGEYTATVTVSDGNGGSDIALVSITVNEDVPPTTGDCTFNTPLLNPLPTTDNTAYENVYVLGLEGPNMDSVEKFVINWDLNNNGLYQFSFNLNRGPWYMNFSSNEQNFNQIYPGIFLTGTSIDGLDGYYYVTMHEGNFVMVAENYTIYFSNSDTAPDCDAVSTSAKKVKELSSVSMFPNPASANVSIQNDTNLKDATISISDLNGKEIRSMSVVQSTTTMNLDLSGIEPGLYLVRIIEATGFSSILKLVIEM